MDNKVMLITGASSGIGKATATLAAQRGFKLILTARSEDKLNALAEALGEDCAMAVAADVTDLQQHPVFRYPQAG